MIKIKEPDLEPFNGRLYVLQMTRKDTDIRDKDGIKITLQSRPTWIVVGIADDVPQAKNKHIKLGDNIFTHFSIIKNAKGETINSEVNCPTLPDEKNLVIYTVVHHTEIFGIQRQEGKDEYWKWDGDWADKANKEIDKKIKESK